MDNIKSRSIAAATVPVDGSDLREQVRILGDDVKELARLTKAAVGEKAQTARQAARGVVDYGREKATAYGDQMSDMTREQPIKALLIAAGVGAVLGLLIRRR